MSDTLAVSEGALARPSGCCASSSGTMGTPILLRGVLSRRHRQCVRFCGLIIRKRGTRILLGVQPIRACGTRIRKRGAFGRSAGSLERHRGDCILQPEDETRRSVRLRPVACGGIALCTIFRMPANSTRSEIYKLPQIHRHIRVERGGDYGRCVADLATEVVRASGGTSCAGTDSLRGCAAVRKSRPPCARARVRTPRA